MFIYFRPTELVQSAVPIPRKVSANQTNCFLAIIGQSHNESKVNSRIFQIAIHVVDICGCVCKRNLGKLHPHFPPLFPKFVFKLE